MTGMNFEVKTLWLEALRSSEYEQGTGALAYTDDDGVLRHCCLGVLCAEAVKAGVRVVVGSNDDGVTTFDDMGGVLPLAVQNWAGLDDDNPDVTVDGALMSIATANDEYDQSFTDIAVIIEREF